MSPYRSGPGGGAFGSNIYPSSRLQIDLAGGLEGLGNATSMLIRNAYMAKRQQQADQERQGEIAYRRSRDAIADQRYADERTQQQFERDRRYELDKARVDATNARAGWVPPSTDLTAESVGRMPLPTLAPLSTPQNASPTMGPLAPAPIPQAQTNIGRAMTARSPSVADLPAPQLTPSAPPTDENPGVEMFAPRLLTTPGRYDPNRDATILRSQARADQTTNTRVNAYTAAGLTREQAMAAAADPALATRYLSPKGKKVYFDVDGTPLVVDAQNPTFPEGFRGRAPGTRTSTRDPNVSVAAATQRAIGENDRQQTAATKRLIKPPPEFSLNARADSSAMVGGNTSTLGKLGEIAVRGDSLRKAYDTQASAIGTSTRASGAVDESAIRQDIATRRQQMEAIVNNPKTPLAVKARAQELFRQHLESLGVDEKQP
jgi:hypothetical protein